MFYESTTTLVEPAVEKSSFPITLVLSRDDPCNCTISLGDKTLFTTQTRREITKVNFARNELAFTTDVFDSTLERIASLIWCHPTSDLITWPAQGMENTKLSRWLKKSLVPFNKAATFKDPEGNAYKWDTKGHRNQLRLLTGTNSVIAYFERANPYVNLKPGFNYNPSPTPSKLHLSTRADEMREAVVLSFLFLEKDRRQEEKSVMQYADGAVAMGQCLGMGAYPGGVLG